MPRWVWVCIGIAALLLILYLVGIRFTLGRALNQTAPTSPSGRWGPFRVPPGHVHMPYEWRPGEAKS